MDKPEEHPDGPGTEDLELTQKIPASENPPAESGDRYKVQGLLGEGGMGKVYKAYDLQLQRTVALKFIRGADEKLKTRLIREARAQARIDHDNVCKIYEVGEDRGKSYIAMQYIAGRPMSTMAGEMILEQKVMVMAKVAEALHEAHQLGIIHRDVKPSNIMLERKEDGSYRPYLMDFGIAREDESPITITEGIIGTPHYMSPEQILGQRHLIDRRTDVYSFGATLYSILVNRPPFEGSATEVLVGVTQHDAVAPRRIDPRIPEDLETIVLKCLEKQPQDRYESARAVADDLNRYLRGDSIQARPATLAMRIYKKARKHKAIAAAAVISLLIIFASSGFVFYTRRVAQKQAESAQKFGQEVTEIEGIMRSAYLWPLHDVTPEKNSVRTRMKWIEAEMTEFGKAGIGPGQNALGRGHLALGEYEEAHDHLQKAWEAGYRRPGVAYSLGIALGALYQRELEELEGTKDKAVRKIKTREAEDKYRAPALQYLQAGRSEATEYVEALIAFYEKRWDRALQKIGEARKRNSNLYEASFLEGEVYRSIANEHAVNGRYAEATQNFTKALERYAEVVEIARSDPAGYGGLCWARYQYAYMKQNGEGGDVIPDLKESMKACDQGLKADSQNLNLLITQARVCRNLSESLTDRGVEASFASSLFMRSKELAGRAVNIAPGNARAHSALGAAYEAQGNNEWTSGQDPRSSLLKAVKSYQTATHLLPGYDYAYLAIGSIYTDLAQYEMSHGRDPRSYLHESIKSNELLSRIRPEYYGSYVNNGLAHAILAEYAIQTGRDPSEDSQKANQFFAKSSLINPKLGTPYNNQCSVDLTLGIYDIEHGKNPTEILQKGIENCKIALKINPTFRNSFINIAQSYRVLSEYSRLLGLDVAESQRLSLENLKEALTLNPTYIETFLEYGEIHKEIALSLLDSGHSPTGELDEAESYAQKSIASDGTDYRGFLLKARVLMIRARRLMKTRSPADEPLRLAARNLQNSLAINANEPEIFQSLAEYHRLNAESLLTQGKTPDKDLEEGLQVIEKALSLKPDLAESIAIRGILCLLKSASLQDAQSKQTWMEQARQAFEKALLMNKNLQRLYDPYAKKALGNTVISAAS